MTASTETPSPGSEPPRQPRYGELAPDFMVASERNPRFRLRSLGGRWILLLFFGSLGFEAAEQALRQVMARRALFDDRSAMFFGVSVDQADRGQRGLKNSMPGVRYFWDFDLALSRRYGCVDGSDYEPTAFLLDRNLRIASVEPIEALPAMLDRVQTLIRAEPPQVSVGAPVLTVPRILDPDFCRQLIDLYEAEGGAPSGFMRAVDGMTVAMLDDGAKRRADLTIADESLRHGLRWRLHDRLAPMIEQAFCWRPTRVERFIVARYAAEDGGFFAPHRDNTTPGTAHRRFAVTINLNDDFDGGELRFPEFGDRTYRPPVGGATVFSCSLLHEATPVTRGLRYATLPFLYDEAGARLRGENAHTVVGLAGEAPAST